MTQEDLQPTLEWVRWQKKKLEKTPFNEIDPDVVKLIGDVEYFALKRYRELAGKFDE